MIRESIGVYGEFVDNFDISPSEAVEMLCKRSVIENHIHKLSIEARHILIEHDLKLIKNSKRMFKHIEETFDFSLSKKPISEWWWHLDKVASGEIEFFLSPNIESD